MRQMTTAEGFASMICKLRKMIGAERGSVEYSDVAAAMPDEVSAGMVSVR